MLKRVLWFSLMVSLLLIVAGVVFAVSCDYRNQEVPTPTPTSTPTLTPTSTPAPTATSAPDTPEDSSFTSEEKDWIIWECEHCGQQMSCLTDHPPGVCRRCEESDWKIINRITVSTRDADNDWISDRLELELGTDPLRIDTDGDGIDDFNEVFTYPHLLDPLDPTDAKEFLAMLPNVEAKGYKNADYTFVGGTEPVKSLNGGPSVYKCIEVAERDPLVRWYVNKTEIQWSISPDGNREGRVMVNGEPYFQKYGWTAADGISYFLTHEREGVCGNYAWNLTVLLDLKGYQVRTLRVEFEPHTIFINGEPVGARGHVWVEVIIDGQIYEIDFDRVMPKEEFYRAHSDWTPIINYQNNWPSDPG